MLERIDEWLREVGTQRLVDGDKVRDMLLDLRLMVTPLQTDNTLQADYTAADTYPLMASDEAGI